MFDENIYSRLHYMKINIIPIVSNRRYLLNRNIDDKTINIKKYKLLCINLLYYKLGTRQIYRARVTLFQANQEKKRIANAEQRPNSRHYLSFMYNSRVVQGRVDSV